MHRRELSAQLSRGLESNRVCVIAADPRNHATCDRDGITDSVTIARRIGEIVAGVVESEEYTTRIESLILVGGTTARYVLELLEVASVAVRGEIEPGVVVSRAVARDGSHAYNLVTKSGGFGDDHTLLRLCSGMTFNGYGATE